MSNTKFYGFMGYFGDHAVAFVEDGARNLVCARRIEVGRAVKNIRTALYEAAYTYAAQAARDHGGYLESFRELPDADLVQSYEIPVVLPLPEGEIPGTLDVPMTALGLRQAAEYLENGDSTNALKCAVTALARIYGHTQPALARRVR